MFKPGISVTPKGTGERQRRYPHKPGGAFSPGIWPGFFQEHEPLWFGLSPIQKMWIITQFGLLKATSATGKPSRYLRLDLPIHNHQLEKFQVAHNFDTIAPTILVPLAQPQ